MYTLAAQVCEEKVLQEYARVLEKTGEVFRVDAAGSLFSVQRALSCVVEPQPGDRVLICYSGFEPGYILAVLERQENAVRMQFPGDVEIVSETGRVGISSAQGIDLTGAEVALVASQLDVTATQGNLHMEQLSFGGSLYQGSVKAIKLFAETLESISDRIFAKTRTSQRVVDELEQLQAGRINYKAEQSLQLRGSFTQLTAREDVHIDGSRVNIG